MIPDKKLKKLWLEHSNKSITFLIAITISCFIYHSYSTISDENQGSMIVLQRDYKNTSNMSNQKFRKENFILGIFSQPTDQNLRNAQRNTWLKMPDNLFNYKYIILDHEKTDVNVAESEVYEDILFLKIPDKTKLDMLLSAGDNTTNNNIVNYNSAMKLKYWFKWVFENEIQNQNKNSKIKLIGKADSDTFICSEQIFHELAKYKNENLFYSWTKNDYKIGDTFRRVDEMFVAFGMKVAEKFAELNFCRNSTKLPQNSSEEQQFPQRPCIRPRPLWKFIRKIYKNNISQLVTVNESERMIQHIQDKVPDICNSYRGYEETPIRRMYNLQRCLMPRSNAEKFS